MVTKRDTKTEWRVVNEQTGAKMGYRYLGNTGLKVSVIGCGTVNSNSLNLLFGMPDNKARNEETQKQTNEIVKSAFDRGVNTFDTAEFYDYGASEVQLGVALRNLQVERKDYVVITKLLKGGHGVNDMGLSRKHVIEGMRNSLKRLNMDYVDIVLASRPDTTTPLEETVRAFSWLVDHGLCHYWGTSEWSASMIESACQIAERLHLHAPVMDQAEYNMLHRYRMEKDYRTLFETRHYGITSWGAVSGGILTGKYVDGIPEGSRLELAKPIPPLSFPFDRYLAPDKIKDTNRKLKALNEIAKANNVSMAALATAWVLAYEDISCALAGFTKAAYIGENLSALALLEKWTPELEKEIEAILQNAPEQDGNPKTWQPFPSKRPH